MKRYYFGVVVDSAKTNCFLPRTDSWSLQKKLSLSTTNRSDVRTAVMVETSGAWLKLNVFPSAECIHLAHGRLFHVRICSIMQRVKGLGESTLGAVGAVREQRRSTNWRATQLLAQEEGKTLRVNGSEVEFLLAASM